MKTYVIDEFNQYLIKQIGQPYLWGGQHTELTPENYEYVIKKHESEVKNQKKVIAYCKKKFAVGIKVLYAYDCSGLGMYYLQNLTHIFPKDMTADGMMRQCKMITYPSKGDWVFRVGSDGKATHIGYMLSDTEVIHAKGRDLGVISEKYKPSYWQKVGRPKCAESLVPVPDPSDPFIFTRVLKKGCKGQDVVELKKLLIAHGFGKGITIDTLDSLIFGTNTRLRVMDYQRSVGLKVDGIAGHDTIVSLGGIWLG